MAAIKAMNWGESDMDGFLQTWVDRLQATDPQDFRVVDGVSASDLVFDYLKRKVVKNVHDMRKPGQAAWAFMLTPETRMVKGMIFSDGTPSGCSTEWSGTNGYGDKWWPIIYIEDSFYSWEGKVPFYCPSLAEDKARPWYAAQSRLRRIVQHVLPASVPEQLPADTETPQLPDSLYGADPQPAASGLAAETPLADCQGEPIRFSF